MWLWMALLCIAVTPLCGVAGATTTIPELPVYSIESIEAADDGVALGSGMLVLEDKGARLTVEEALGDVAGWHFVEKESPNFGFTQSAYWFRFAVENPKISEARVLLELPIPFLDDVQFYHYFYDSLVSRYQVGDLLPYSQRPVNHQNFVIPLRLLPGTNEILVRVASAGTVEAPLIIWEPEAFYIQTGEARMLQGIFAGVMLIMVIYNLFLYFSVRDKSYIYYVGFVLSFLLFLMSLKGYGYAYLWSHSVYFNSFAIATFIALSEVFFGLFTISFLRLKELFPTGYLILMILTTLSALLAVLSLVAPYSVTIRITTALVLPVCGAAIYSGYLVWWRGGMHARYFCLASTAIILGISVLVLGKFGLMPSNFWTENAAQMAALMQVSMLSLALADRINGEKQLRINAQAEVLKQEQMLLQSQAELIAAQEEANRSLERKVTDRTQELQTALDELAEVNERLQQVSVTDALTGINNRAYFSERFAEEFARAHRQRVPLSLILCDIDHFKLINDTHGHLTGDECLRQVAMALQEQVTRSGDVLARYGGEEFVIMLVNTPLQAAIGVAENLRRSIASTPLMVGEAEISLTASFGVACVIPPAIDGEDTLLQRADDCLYQAKAAGRNCVRS